MTAAIRTRVRIAGLLVIAAFLLAGCMQLHVTATVSANNTVSGETKFGVEKSLVAGLGGSQQFYAEFGSADTCDSSGGSAKLAHYDDGTYLGVVCTFTDQPIAEFGKQGILAGSGLRITRDGNRFILNGVIDLAGEATSALPSGAASDVPNLPDIASLLSSADIKIRFSFPGPVTSSNGKIDHHTVTFSPDASGKIDMQATASAVPGGGSGMPAGLLIGIIAAIVVVVALLVLLIVRRQRPQAVPAGIGPYPFPPGGDAGWAGAPPQAYPSGGYPADPNTQYPGWQQTPPPQPGPAPAPPPAGHWPPTDRG